MTRREPERDHSEPDARRRRLIDAMTALVGQHGYLECTIGATASRARVSRATFYEQFAGKQECFLAAMDLWGERFARAVAQAVSGAPAREALPAAAGELCRLADAQPAPFQLLTHESLLAGEQAQMQRERLIGRLAENVEARLANAGTSGRAPDLPASTVLGGVVRMLGIRLRQGQEGVERLAPEFAEWLACYEAPQARHRWRSWRPRGRPRMAREPARQGAAPPPALPRGRHRMPEPLVERVQRERIMHATAQAIYAKGYAEATVADIVRDAGVSRAAFYRSFPDKRSAYGELIRYMFEEVFAATGGAFFAAGGSWPERVWEAGEGLTGFFAEEPAFAHAGWVESHALGPSVAPADGFLIAFSVFLEEGQVHRPAGRELPQFACHAVAATILECGIQCVSRRQPQEMPALLPLVVLIVLAPFLGIEEASRFVREKTGGRMLQETWGSAAQESEYSPGARCTPSAAPRSR